MPSQRGRQFWSDLVAAFLRSGQTQRAFAAARQVRLRTLRSWIYRLRDEQADDTRILPVRVVAPRGVEQRSVGGVVELVTPGGQRLRFPVGTDPDYLADLAARLG